ncbi:hypothetical protein DYB25_005872 [Aphanomyces astaci]|uniref:PH domain-containing protein n=2 Tax=Aphanomyces astaci TaxID=112090 RepID=A0A397DE77_APHAT|nr:hypothetical protein DYB36_007666 [Aphanomyces astaci]RHY20876.1 hypothetical protein DYB25_005872 [Aphanomyces astaci]RHY60485.1 hypothetical protein DYB30_007870 [Aphanomyces astaci]RHY62589.1 hypothetical protein DYB34_003526 [Aphanomyces astaci]RHY82881.1 hypothetical protein DYB26_002659 [Aphanomyces astaci]
MGSDSKRQIFGSVGHSFHLEIGTGDAMSIINLDDNVKQGVLYKRGAGGFLKRKNWKRRYFQLNDGELRYYDTTSGVQKGVVRLSTNDFVEIMPRDCYKTGTSASTEWRLAVNTPSRRFFLSASTEYDMYQWADAITKALPASRRKACANDGHTARPRMCATIYCK